MPAVQGYLSLRGLIGENSTRSRDAPRQPQWRHLPSFCHPPPLRLCASSLLCSLLSVSGPPSLARTRSRAELFLRYPLSLSLPPPLRFSVVPRKGVRPLTVTPPPPPSLSPSPFFPSPPSSCPSRAQCAREPHPAGPAPAYASRSCARSAAATMEVSDGQALSSTW